MCSKCLYLYNIVSKTTHHCEWPFSSCFLVFKQSLLDPSSFSPSALPLSLPSPHFSHFRTWPPSHKHPLLLLPSSDYSPQLLVAGLPTPLSCRTAGTDFEGESRFLEEEKNPIILTFKKVETKQQTKPSLFVSFSGNAS